MTGGACDKNKEFYEDLKKDVFDLLNQKFSGKKAQEEKSKAVTAIKHLLESDIDPRHFTRLGVKQLEELFGDSDKIELIDALISLNHESEDKFELFNDLACEEPKEFIKILSENKENPRTTVVTKGLCRIDHTKLTIS